MRPTSDRVREAIFDILFSLGGVEGLMVADLFAGSGALGIEALSRGAASVTFVDSDQASMSCIREKLTSVGMGDAERDGDATLVRADVTDWVSTTASRYDLVLCDPPTHSRDGPNLVPQLPANLAILESGCRDCPAESTGGESSKPGAMAVRIVTVDPTRNRVSQKGVL